MIDCVITTPVPASQYIHVELKLNLEKGENCRLQLAAWRPGKYFISNYAQFVRGVVVTSEDRAIEPAKYSKDLWGFTAIEKGNYSISYHYFAGQMDAGGSWLDPEQLYINFINLFFSISGKEQNPIRVTLKLSPEFKVATALPTTGLPFQYLADDYQHLVDSPLIASPTILHYSYLCHESVFHLWFQGSSTLDAKALIPTFKAFTERQIRDFGGFAAKDYHFLFQLLPYPHYHGVEHKFSTVITLGPSEKLFQQEYQDALVGVSSHELYHFWNVCRIRPKELLPYDFTKETYLDSGWLLEGVTTYLGDLYLLKSGYYSLERYLGRFQRVLEREFNSWGWKYQSVVDSSFDLWLDGYQPGIPDKKVSIYNRGALLSFCLDVALIVGGSSLPNLMRQLYETFGKKNRGYTMKEIRNIISEYDQPLWIWDSYFEDFIFGRKDLFPLVNECLECLGIRCIQHPREDILSGNFGIIADPNGDVKKVHPDSEAYHKLMIGDKISSYSTTDLELKLHVIRREKPMMIQLGVSNKSYFHEFELIVQKPSSIRDKWMK